MKMSEERQPVAPLGLGEILRAYARQSPLRGGWAPPLDRARILAGLDRVFGRRGLSNPARRFSADRLEGAGPDLHLETLAVGRGAPTVIFMPGTNAYALLYAELLAALADRGFNVVGFDPRGHGLSQGRRGSYTIPDLVEDMDRVVNHARRQFGDPVVVAGSSQGGITAFYFAAGPHPVAGALCHNAADLRDPRSLRLTRIPVGVSRRLAPLLRAVARLFPELPIPMAAYLDLAKEPVSGLGSARDVLHRDPALVPFVRLRTLASLSSAPLPRPVEQIRVPILFLHGGDDTIFPEALIRDLHARVGGPSRLAFYPGLPHYLIVDHVERILEDVVAWLREVCDGGAG